MWSNFLMFEIRLAATLRTDCSLLTTFLLFGTVKNTVEVINTTRYERECFVEFAVSDRLMDLSGLN